MSVERSNAVGDGGVLPEDQLFEMLTRVALDDLAACRQVSTRWRRLTYEPGFAPLHCRRAAAVSGYFVQTMARNRYSATFVSMHPSPSKLQHGAISLDFLPSRHVRVEAVSPHRGLVCYVEPDTARKGASYYVCKPATRQWRALPNPRVRYPTATTAAMDFKIVRFSVPTLRDCLRCEVFDSRRPKVWRRSADVILRPESLSPAAPAVRAHGGVVHWLRWPDRLGGAQDIFAFDVNSETWRLIGLPPEATEKKRSSASKKIVAVEGKLCLVVVVDEEVEVWMLANYKEERWEKTMVASLKSVVMHEGALVFRDLCSSSIAFLHGVFKVIWYDFWRGKLAEAPVLHKCIQEVFKYESDLVPCDIPK